MLLCHFEPWCTASSSLALMCIRTRVELCKVSQVGRTVETNTSRNRQRPDEPGGDGGSDGELALLDVVGKHILKAHVRVKEESHREPAIHGTRHAMLHSSNRAEWHKRRADQTLKRPVVGTVVTVGRGVLRRIVHRALDVRWRSEKSSYGAHTATGGVDAVTTKGARLRGAHGRRTS